MFKVINKDKYMNDLGRGEVGLQGVPFSLLCQQKLIFPQTLLGSKKRHGNCPSPKALPASA